MPVFSRKNLFRASLISYAAIMLVFFQNCAEQPQVEDPSAMNVSFQSSSFIHSGKETTCLSCHEKQRPAVMASGVPHDKTQDCLKCHTAGTAWAGAGTAKFNHTSLGANDTCISCHLNARPSGFVGPAQNQFNHSTPEGQVDCKSCHMASAGITWTGGLFVHSPIPTACMTCHLADRPSATTKVPANNTDNIFFHNTQFVGSLDCAGCHAQDQSLIGKSWNGGNFNHKQPGTNATINTCQTCHNAKRPTAAVNGFSHATSGTGDCVSCHAAGAGVSWSTSRYHTTGAAIPVACQSCHASTRPGPTVVTPSTLNGVLRSAFLHDTTKYIGSRDCVACHANNSANKANVGKNWSAAYFDHKDPNTLATITTCQDCHRAQRTPGIAQGNPAYDHNNGGMGDCVSCHKNPGVAWSGAVFSHSPAPTACATCHENKRPSSTTYYPSITSANRFRHLIEFGGTGDCKSCHYSSSTNMARIGVTWNGGDYTHMDTKGVIVKSCLDCHQVRGNKEHCRTGNVVQDCYQCHSRSSQSATNVLPKMSWSHSGGDPSCK